MFSVFGYSLKVARVAPESADTQTALPHSNFCAPTAKVYEMSSPSKNRKKAASQYDHLYARVNGERANLYWKCVYCGRPADTIDHCPPISRVDDYRALGLKREIYLKVPSCAPCNRILGDSLQETFIDRAEHLKDKISRKYARHLRVAEWDEDEMEELGPNLRGSVAAANRRRDSYSSMIDYYEGIDEVIANIEHI